MEGGEKGVDMSLPSSTAPRAIVADVDESTVGPLLDALRTLAFEVEWTRTVPEMLVALSKTANALLFIDEDFDTRRGLDLVKHLTDKAEDEGRRLTVMVLSAAHDPLKALAATRAGATRYVAKPIRPAVLSQVVAEARSLALEASAAAAPAHPSPPPDDEATDDDALVEALHPLRRYPMNRMALLDGVPAEAGVILFYDDENRPLLVEWTERLAERLGYYVGLHPALSELVRRAKSFEIFPTDDSQFRGKFFDRLVNKHGCFPLMMTEAPEGSRHHPEGDAAHAREVKKTRDDPAARKAAASVTHYAKPAPGTVEDLEKMIALNPSDPDIQDWLAFSLYSNHMYAESIRWYGRLIKNGSRKEEHFFYCGNAFFRTGDLEHARKMWTIATRLHPGSEISRKSRERLAALKLKQGA